MTQLTSLNLAHNRISSVEGVSHVLEVPTLQTLDLQHNRIEDPAVLDIFAQMPELRVLYLMGNPVVKHIKHYRRAIVARCKSLRYLDDRPVFDEERRRTDAWARGLEEGGIEAAQEAERLELHNIRKEKDETEERNFRAFESMMREGLEIRRQRELAAAAAAAGGPGVDATPRVETAEAEVNLFSGETIIHVPESESLRLARERRWRDDTDDKHIFPFPSPPPLIDDCSILPPPPPTSQRMDAQPQSGAAADDDCASPVSFLPPPPPGGGKAAESASAARWTRLAISDEEEEELGDEEKKEMTDKEQISPLPLLATDLTELD